MYVNVEIHYRATSGTRQSGSFPTRGRTMAQVALSFWKEIKREMSQIPDLELEKILVQGKDITNEVLALEKEELLHNLYDNLPF